MPNHIHGIIFINLINNVAAVVQANTGVVKGQEGLRVQNIEPLRQQNQYQHIIPKSIGTIIRGFKIGVTKWFRKNTDIHNVWQRNFYERVIRNENELNRIREYIINNPLQWEHDDENPKNTRISHGDEVFTSFCKGS